MKKDRKKYKKLFLSFFVALILVSSSFFIYSLLSGRITFGEIENAWDGESISNHFTAGNGTKENPYIIQSPDDFIYFRTLIEGDEYSAYQDKYYALDKDLDFGNHSLSGIGIVQDDEERIFKGHLDGRGHTISHIKIDKAVKIEDISYYSLFTKTKDATIENLIIRSYTIFPLEDKSNIVIGGIAGEVLSSTELFEKVDVLSEFKNISLVDLVINIKDIKKDNIQISSLTNNLSSKCNLSNISIIGKILGNNLSNHISIINGNIDGDVSNIIHNVALEDCDKVDFFNEKIKNLYLIDKDSIYLDGKVITNEDLLLKINEDNIDYYWDLENNEYILKKYEKIDNNNDSKDKVVGDTAKSFSFSIQKASDFSIHDSGIVGDNVYINDLDSDLDYYRGLNYTTSTNNDTPNMNDKGLYSDNNLVKFQIIYHGNTDSRHTGTISYESGERQNTIIYYKYYPVSGNSIDIELIDNPFSGRPNDLAFNGWYSIDNDISFYLDTTYYVWHAVVPMNGESEKVVELYASWVEATMEDVRSNGSIQYALSGLNNAGMTVADTSEQRSRVLNIINSDRYYYIRVLLERYDSQVGYYNSYGYALSGTCNNKRGCTVYQRLTAGDEYVSGTTYYYSTGYGMYTIDPRVVEYYREINDLYTDMNMAGYYEQITLQNGQSQNGMVDSNGNSLSGNCSGTCTVYQKIKYSDGNGNYNVVDANKTYYYLVTRDTNIVYYNYSYSGTWSSTKPFTLTSYYNGTDSRSYYYNMNNYPIQAVADTRIEYLYLYCSETGSTSSSGLTSSSDDEGYIYANHHNLKIGRGITRRSSSYKSAIGVTGSISDGTSRNSKTYNNTKYKMIVESGYYTYASSIIFRNSYSTYNYPSIITVWGNDYDRIKKDFDNLDIYKTLYGNMAASVICSPVSNLGLTQIIKSGRIGSYTNNTDNTLGIYATSNYSNGFACSANVIVENGIINNIYGGPGPNSNMQNYNAVRIYFKDGEADTIFGGGAYLTSYGNRILQVTGGKVKYSIAGGSNGYRGDEAQGTSYIATLNGDTYVYVGGSSEIGDTDLISNGSKFEMEAGSVFGVANGKSSSTVIGSVDNSYLVINGGTIHNNVYGGANYGAVAASKTSGTYNTNIKLLSGTVDHSVYGGGNNNGAGNDNASVNTFIDVIGTTVKGSVYGGSKTKGTIYGSSSINISGGKILTDVYGGGEGGYSSNSSPGTYVRDNVSVTVSNGIITGNVYGGSAYGTVNALNQNTNISGATTQVTVSGGVIQNSVFGGGKGSSSYTPKVVGNIVVNINGGSIGKVFGGFDASGKPSARDNVYLRGGTIGNAFGGGNNANQDSTDIHLQGSTITGNLYGGSNLLGTVTDSHVTVISGSVVDIYGGNNLDGLTITTNVLVSGGNIQGDIYGGGNQAETATTNVDVNGVINIDNVYGGGNQAGVSNSTNVNIAKGTINGVYGGSNQTGIVGETNVTVGPDTSNYYDDYTIGGSGLEVSFNYRFSSAQYQTNLYPEYKTIVDVTPVFRNTTEEDFDEWSVVLNIPDSTFFVHDGDANIIVNGESYTWNQDDRWWGTNPIPSGSTYSPSLPLRVLFKGTENDFRLIYYLEAIDGNNGFHKKTNDPNYVSPTQGGGIDIDTIYGGNNIGGTVNISNVMINNGTIGEIYGGGNQVGLTTSNVEITGGNITSVYGGSNRNGNVTTSNVTIGGENTINITDVYGGNNLGGVTSSTNINAYSGTITTIYGGGNEASVGSTNVIVDEVSAVDIYGGGNAAGVTGNTSLDINGATVSNNIYGGGNEGVVQGSTNVTVTDAHILGNAFAGGNGSMAVVHTNSTITIDGKTEIGTSSSTAPNAGCVFGSGNAASTGIEGVDSSKATVNIVGGIVHGNVYGGPKMAVVYGTTDTNIGSSSVSLNGLLEDDIHISGTVFGGGESNASGSETYDWTFISVTRGIDVYIDGTDYITHNHDFIINGSIFGSGNASSSSGISNITIKNLGSRSQPNKSISVQRANNLVVDHSVIELEGTTDRTNEYSDIFYSFNMIDKLVIKNDTVLLLQHNANMLKELYSGVDSNGSIVTAKVDIDEENKSVSKNVDNRIYMLPGQNLNISINQSATAYGKVTGMTFFGMYNGYENGTYRFGLYDDDLDYGDSGNAGLEIVGGSYVIGLRNVNHDITKDGFYSNYLNDDYTEVAVNYIDPSPIGETGYRWIVGFEAINYEFTLNASKYSSLGTYELQLIDFADGNTIFNVIGFDSSGLNPEIQLVDSNNVPRVGRTENDANHILGLSMKAETQEWTGYGTTKLLGDSTITGDREYKTDSRKLAPSLMFYLYHAKNINSEGKLGTVVLTLRADIPKNAIEYDIKFVTVTINLVAKKYDDADSYDASITYDKRYDMPSSTLVNITNQSQFSAYYSLIAWNDRFENVYGNNNTNYHVLTTNSPLPVNTMITMLDYGANPNRPDYYYFTVTQSVYNDSLQQLSQYNEVVYPLRNFIKMDSTSTNNTYSDQVANRAYYDSEAGLVDEEFMFIFDFKETNTTGEHLNNTMLFELRNHEDRTVYNVLGIRESLMVYNTYESSNVVLEQTITDTDQYLYYNIPDEFNYSTKIQYNQTENRQSVIDTNYESSSMGLNVSFYDKDDVPVSSSMLIGTSIVIDNQEYFADGDGVFRIKLAKKVSNLNKMPKITVNKDLPAGEYTIKYTLFASDDGLHNSVYENSVTQEFVVHVVNADNSITVDCDDEYKIVDGDTGLNMKKTTINRYTVKYDAELNNPNFRVEIYKRNTDDPNTTGYTSVPFRILFSTTFSRIRDNEVYIEMGNSHEKTFDFDLQELLTSGTYRIVFKLYDNDQLIDSEVKYVIVSKKTE